MDRRATATVFLLMAACATKPAPSSVAHTQAPILAPMTPARKANSTVGQVTVAIVVDQFAAWIARQRLGLLPKEGGFALLRQEGTWYRDMRFAHAITETAPGHASLYSGKVPREHGIVSNELSVGGHATGILVDKNTRIVAAEGARTETGSSALALTSEVVADRFKAQSPTGKVYSFSLKDRGAIFGGGQHSDLTLWYDASLGQFVSSTAFARQLPNWVLPALGQSVIKERMLRPWALMDPTWVAKNSLTQDDQAGEGNLANFGTVFAHATKDSSKPFVAFRADPESDRLLLELGLLALDNSPADQPVLLAISLSANDYIGHFFGPDSWEAWDELRRLDAALGWFFSELDRRKGRNHWSVVLSADHGVAPLPEVSRVVAKQYHEGGALGTRPRDLTERVLPATLEKAAREAAEQALGKGDWVAALVEPYLYLSDNAKGLDAKKLAKLRRAVTEIQSRMPGIAKLLDMMDVPSRCPTADDDSFDALLCRSVQPGRGGDYFIALKPGYFFDPGYVPGFGTSHGNAGLYDRSVPLMVRAMGQAEAGKVVDAPQSFELFSSQLEKLLGLR